MAKVLQMPKIYHAPTDATTYDLPCWPVRYDDRTAEAVPPQVEEIWEDIGVIAHDRYRAHPIQHDTKLWETALQSHAHGMCSAR